LKWLNHAPTWHQRLLLNDCAECRAVSEMINEVVPLEIFDAIALLYRSRNFEQYTANVHRYDMLHFICSFFLLRAACIEDTEPLALIYSKRCFLELPTIECTLDTCAKIETNKRYDSEGAIHPYSSFIFVRSVLDLSRFITLSISANHTVPYYAR
jgi:hypothetical protein